MQSLIRDWDGEYVITRHDLATEAWIFIAVHSTRLGRPLGGTRMLAYDTPASGLHDAQRLATAMTYKWAAIDFPIGGGKAAIALSRALSDEERRGLLALYGALVESLGGAFATGADMGVGPREIALLARHTRHVLGRPVEEGGAGDPGPFTALGVFVSIEAVARALGSQTLAGLQVVIQGVGDVGVPLARRLAEAGATLALCDSEPQRTKELADELGARVVDPAAVYSVPCDVFAPCAIAGVLDPDIIPGMRCRAVAGAANAQLATPESAEQLHAAGILYAPDFIVNAGGAIHHAGIERLDLSLEEVEAKIVQIRQTLSDVLDEARDNDESPVHAAKRRAERVLGRS